MNAKIIYIVMILGCVLSCKNNKTEVIFQDYNDRIRKELSYCYTPVIIGLNSGNNITSIFFPIGNKKQVNEIIKFQTKFTTTID